MISKFSHLLSWMVFGACLVLLITEIAEGSFITQTLVATMGWLIVIIYERRLGIK